MFPTCHVLENVVYSASLARRLIIFYSMAFMPVIKAMRLVFIWFYIALFFMCTSTLIQNNDDPPTPVSMSYVLRFRHKCYRTHLSLSTIPLTGCLFTYTMYMFSRTNDAKVCFVATKRSQSNATRKGEVDIEIILGL